MKLGFVREDGAGGVNMTFSDVGEHNLDEEDGFRAAVTEGCAALGLERSEWAFKMPAFHMEWDIHLILCKPEGGTPVLPGFMLW